MTTRTCPVAPRRALPRSAAGLALIAVGLGACAATPPARPPQVGYLAPSSFPPGARSAVIRQQPDLLLGNIVDRLQQDSFEIVELDEQAGFVVARYSGDPEPYVDCGWIMTYATGELDRLPAATADASFDRLIERSPAKLNRQLQLDGRMVVSLTPRGANTLVSASTTYVLTKTVDLADPAGASRGEAREIISFDTGESATFTKGTRCQPNGRLERVVYDSLPATSFVAQREQPAPDTAVASTAEPPAIPLTPELPPAPAVPAPPPVAAPSVPVQTAQADTRATRQGAVPAVAAPLPASEPIDVATLEARVDAVTAAMPCATVDAEIGDDNRVSLSGYVDSEADVARLRESLAGTAGVGVVDSALEVQPWPFCQILQVIDPYRSPDRQHGLVVTTADRETALREGDLLTLDIFLPPDAEYLYLGYVQSDGRVGYITIMPVEQWVKETGAIRFETGFEISAPFGREMIVAVTSARPLFTEALPAYQAPEDYVALLQQRLATQGGGSADGLDASHLIITTHPNPAF
jgi:hypothetical protein